MAGLAILSDGLAVVLGALSRIGGCCVASYACHIDGSLCDRSQIVLTFHVSSPVAPTWIPKTGARASMIARLDET